MGESGARDLSSTAASSCGGGRTCTQKEKKTRSSTAGSWERPWLLFTLAFRWCISVRVREREDPSCLFTTCRVSPQRVGGWEEAEKMCKSRELSQRPTLMLLRSRGQKQIDKVTMMPHILQTPATISLIYPFASHLLLIPINLFPLCVCHII